MKWAYLALVIWMVATVQAHLLGSFSGPLQLLVVIIIGTAMVCRLPVGLAAGLWGGFWLDGASGLPFGAYMLFYSLLVVAVAVLKRQGLVLERGSALLLTACLASLIYNLWLLVWSWVAIGEVIWPANLILPWLLGALATGILAVLLNRRVRLNLKYWGISGAKAF